MKPAPIVLAALLLCLTLRAACAAEANAADHAGMDHSGMDRTVHGMYGPYPMTREASGTSWQPDSTPHEGLMDMHGDWMTMLHGETNLIYDRQGGPRGDDKSFSTSMLMLMGQRPLGTGTLGLRGMVSADPLMGNSGYPLLLQTGETADGRTPLIDRQHPHDLLMELAASYSVPVSETGSAFLYAGLPGEPALGPPAFMHRFSGADNPEAPITHHWLDSTHITFGVVTLGYIAGPIKLEGSAFRGREPDQYRYNVDSGKLDSAAVRLSYNPARDWSLQLSRGHIASPEALEPEVNVNRTTASVMYNRGGRRSNWQTLLAWGRNAASTGTTTDAWLLESAVVIRETHTVFARIERAEKNELFEPGSALAEEIFHVGKLSAGYLYDFPAGSHLKFGIGALASAYALPAALQSSYGSDPLSYMVFARVKIH